ncbi:MAG: MarR family winged helix-turn-helix transcriptional regulator [Faecalibacillus sp.]
MDRLEKRLGLLFSLRKEHLNNALKEFGLTYEDYQVISVLQYIDGASIHDLTKRTSYRLQIVENIIQNLLNKGLIEIKEEKICLTLEIKRIYPFIKRKIKEEDEKITEKIPKDEVNQIVETLDKLVEYYDITIDQ